MPKLLTMTSKNVILDLTPILETAREHAIRLQEDVKLASTRIEHVRVTARANEATNLLNALESLLENHQEPESFGA
jgi:hypothetical protein